MSGDDSTNFAQFKFSNSAITQSSITDIYFQDGTLLGISSITYSSGVSFARDAKPGDLPGGNELTPDFVTTAGFSLDSDKPIMHSGVNAASEWVTVGFTLLSGKTIHDTISALDLVHSSGAASIWNNDGSYIQQNVTGLRIGIHVQSIGARSESDSFVNGPVFSATTLQQVPEPNAMVIFGCLSLIAVAFRRGRGKQPD
ncbi:MAG: PEP-CTERM sorting domain-containing protein [Pirellulaceae bacterium]|nr:PEP-CTERM sorting domain-containing protein [Pirellulaceae bacterium]